MKKYMKRIALFTFASLILLTLQTYATAANYKIKAATVLVDDSPTSMMLYMFKNIVESQTNGDIKVEVYTNGKLGDERPSIEACQLNTVQLTTPSVGVLANFNEKFRVANLPFILTDQKVAYKVLVESRVGKELLKEVENNGLIGLGWGDFGMRNLTTRKKIKKLADLKGMKIRTMKVPDHLTLWKSLGANPTPIAFSELYTAMQQRLVDGQENPYENIYLFKFYEVQKYTTVTTHIYDVQPVLMSKKFYTNLPPEYQKIVQMAADISIKYNWHITGIQNAMFKKKLQDTGMNVSRLSDAEIANFRKAAKPVVSEIRKIVGNQLVDAYIKAAEKAREM